MIVAITGHRPNKLGNDYDLKSPLIEWIKGEIIEILRDISNISETPLILMSRMALGIDTLFCKIAIQHKFPLISVIPFKGQELMWPKVSKEIYYEILKKALNIHIVDTNTILRPNGGNSNNNSYDQFLKLPTTYYSPKKMQDGNEWIVNHCNQLIAVWDESPGGTYNCIKYAQSVNKTITYINPKNFKSY